MRRVERAFFQCPRSQFTTTQRMFFEALLADPYMNTAAAAKKVGITTQKATTWVNRPDVIAVLDRMIENRLRLMGINPQDTLAKVLELYDMATGDKPIRKTYFDKDIGALVEQEVRETDLTTAKALLDLISKHLGLYRDDGGTQGMQVSINIDSALFNDSDDSDDGPDGAHTGVTIDHDDVTQSDEATLARLTDQQVDVILDLDSDPEPDPEPEPE